MSKLCRPARANRPPSMRRAFPQERSASDYRLKYRLDRACGMDASALCGPQLASCGPAGCAGRVLRCLRDRLDEVTGEDCRKEILELVQTEVRPPRPRPALPLPLPRQQQPCSCSRAWCCARGRPPLSPAAGRPGRPWPTQQGCRQGPLVPVLLTATTTRTLRHLANHNHSGA